MPTPRRARRLPVFILGCLTVALLAPQLGANPIIPGQTLNYSGGDMDTTPYSTSAPNSPTTLNIKGGTATQSGALSGSGNIIKTGAGTLILSAVNTYAQSTTLQGGTLQVVAGGGISNSSLLKISDSSGQNSSFNLTGGSVSFGSATIAFAPGSFGTVNVSGGTWTDSGNLTVGDHGTGVLNITGGTVSNNTGTVGSAAGSTGTATVTGGGSLWTNQSDLNVGVSGNGTLNVLNGGVVSSVNGFVGTNSNAVGTVLVDGAGSAWNMSGDLTVDTGGAGFLTISHGGIVTNAAASLALYVNDQAVVTVDGAGSTWTSSGDVIVGGDGPGVLNIQNGGEVNVNSGNGLVTLGENASGSGTLNIGSFGGADTAGTLNATEVHGGAGTAEVNFNQTDFFGFSPVMTGSLSVNQIGHGTTALAAASTYMGATQVLGGTLFLDFYNVATNILPATTRVILGSATLEISGSGDQTVGSINGNSAAAGRIIVHENSHLDIGALGKWVSNSALNFDTADGGVVTLSGQTVDSSISRNFTVTDNTGFGLATVDGSDHVIRLTSTALLPANGALVGTDYRIDNNGGGASAAGSSSLVITSTEYAQSITVDTVINSGLVILAPNAKLVSDVWNFGGSQGFQISGEGGLSTVNPGGTIMFNNFSTNSVYIDTPILDNGGSGIQVAGPGTLTLTVFNRYTGDTLVTSGTLAVGENGAIISRGNTTIGSQQGDYANLYVYGSLSDRDTLIGDKAGATGIANVVLGGSLTGTGILDIGISGNGVLNVDESEISSDYGYLGVNAGSSGSATLSHGSNWSINNALYIGQDGKGVVTLSDGSQINVDEGNGTINLGAQGTLNVGTGGSAARPNGGVSAASVSGAAGAVVNVNFNSYGPDTDWQLTLDGGLAVNKTGGGTLIFNSQNSYTGGTTVNAGMLLLSFNVGVSQDMISSSSALTLGGGVLQIFSTGDQTFNGLSTTAGTGSQILLNSDETLTLGALTSIGSGSALNFNTAVGLADGATLGSGVIQIDGYKSGDLISPGFTVSDSTGFGLATVKNGNVIRETGTDLLPDMGTKETADFRIDNNSAPGNVPGSSGLHITLSESARSITVDTTAAEGALVLERNVQLSTDVWNFGSSGTGISSHGYEIMNDDPVPATGLKTLTAGGMLQINNYNGDFITISAPILDHGGSGLRVAGTDQTGATILTGTDTYTGPTIVNGGALFIDGDHSAATGTVTVQSGAVLGGSGILGGDLQVQNGGTLITGGPKSIDSLSGVTATFDTNSIFLVQGDGAKLSQLNLSGAVTIAPGALLSLDVYDLTEKKYVLISAASGLYDGLFTVMDTGVKGPSASAFPASKNPDPYPGYKLVYTGTTLELDAYNTAPAVAFWKGNGKDDTWSYLTKSGNTNWATAFDGKNDTGALPDAPTDVTFSAKDLGRASTNLDMDFTVNSLTVNSDTSIYTDKSQTLTVNTTTTVNARLLLEEGVTLVGDGAFTIGSAGSLSGSGAVQMASNESLFVNGAINVRDDTYMKPFAQVLSITTSGSGAIVMGAGSTIRFDLYSGAGNGDNTAVRGASDILNLHGNLNANKGGTILLGNPNHMTGFAGGDHWRVIALNGGAGTITGHLAVNTSALGLAAGYVGAFDQATGIFSIEDHRAQMSAEGSGLSMTNAEGQSTIAGTQTSTNDVNNHLFNLRSGGGEEEDAGDGSIGASLDYGVVVGQGDGPEDGKNPIAKKVLRSRQWEVFTTVNYGNVKLSPISSQSGVQVDSWASSVGIERHLSRGLTLGFATTYLDSKQTYTAGLGSLELTGLTLSTYLSYVYKNFWNSLLYSFGDYDLDSHRNPGFGLPMAIGYTRSYTNSLQYNTGWNFRFQNNSLVTGPFAGIDYLHGTVDAYGEMGGGIAALRYGKQTFQSLVTRIGWSVSKKLSTQWADITPQVRLSYERQNVKNNGTSVQAINAPFSAAGGNQSPGQDYMVIGTGVNFQFSPDFSMQLGYQTQIFRNNLEAHFGSVRFGYRF